MLDGDEWVINGLKWFTSGANGADLAIAMVITEPVSYTHLDVYKRQVLRQARATAGILQDPPDEAACRSLQP